MVGRGCLYGLCIFRACFMFCLFCWKGGVGNDCVKISCSFVQLFNQSYYVCNIKLKQHIFIYNN